jgi:hypothetical protein
VIPLPAGFFVRPIQNAPPALADRDLLRSIQPPDPPIQMTVLRSHIPLAGGFGGESEM